MYEDETYNDDPGSNSSSQCICCDPFPSANGICNCRVNCGSDGILLSDRTEIGKIEYTSEDALIWKGSGV